MHRQPSLDSITQRCTYAAKPSERPDCQLTAVVRFGSTALCSDCNSRRSTLGKGTAGHPLRKSGTVDVLHWLTQANEQLRDAQADLFAAAQRAHSQGHSWTAIGAHLNITRQAAQQRFRPQKKTGG